MYYCVNTFSQIFRVLFDEYLPSKLGVNYVHSYLFWSFFRIYDVITLEINEVEKVGKSVWFVFFVIFTRFCPIGPKGAFRIWTTSVLGTHF